MKITALLMLLSTACRAGFIGTATNLTQINSVTVSTGAGTADSGTLRVAVGGGVSIAASSNSVATDTFFASAQGNTATAVKTISGNLYGYNIYNPNPSVAFLQIYDAVVGNVTVGTTIPKMSIALPSTANGTIGVDSFFGNTPIGFKNGITVAATATATGSGSPGTGLVVNLSIK